MKQKIKSPSFWMAMLGTIVMLLQIFGITISLPAINEVLGVLGASLICISCLLSNKIDNSTKDDSDNDTPNTAI